MIALHGFIFMSFTGQELAKVIQRLDVVGTDLDGLKVVIHCQSVLSIVLQVTA